MNQERPSRWKSPWLWIGLSCGVLVLAVLGIALAVVVSMVHRYRESARPVRNEPVLVIAERLALKDPDVAVVSHDSANKTVTLSNRKTGERFLLGQVDGNKLRIQTPAGEVVPEFAGPSALVQDPDHQDQEPMLLLGSKASSPPAWMPAGRGERPLPLYSLQLNGVTSGCLAVTPAEPVRDLYVAYREQLTRQGFQVLPMEGAVSASSPDMRSSFFAGSTKPQREPSQVLIVWSEMGGGSGNP